MTRKPKAFSLDDAGLDMTPPSAAPVEDVSNSAGSDVPEEGRRDLWSRVFWGGVASLALCAAGFWVSDLVTSALARNGFLGWAVLAIAGLTGLALAVILIRELLALRRLARFDDLRRDAAEAVLDGSHGAAGAAAARLRAALAGNPRAGQGLATYDRLMATEIIDGRDRLRLIEREVLEPLDDRARRLVSEAARRVSVATALSPRALIDLAIVLYTALTLIRKLAELYGGRPGFLVQGRLLAKVFAHLAVTGGVAAGDEILQQLLGHGLAARLSAKLGEGVLNGLLTARLGLAAMALIRPLPFLASPKPDLKDVTAELIGRG